MVMKKRDAAHYQNINERMMYRGTGRIKTGKEAIMFKDDLFGVVTKVKSKDNNRGLAVIETDLRQE